MILLMFLQTRKIDIMVRLYNEYYAPHPEFKDVIAQVDAHITQALQILEDTCIDPIDAEHYIIGSVTRLAAQRWLKREIERRRYLHKLEREIAEMDKPKPVEELEDGAPGTSGYNSFSGRS